MFQVNTSLIRFWEKEFDIIKPKKIKRGGIASSPLRMWKTSELFIILLKSVALHLKALKRNSTKTGIKR